MQTHAHAHARARTCTKMRSAACRCGRQDAMSPAMSASSAASLYLRSAAPADFMVLPLLSLVDWRPPALALRQAQAMSAPLTLTWYASTVGILGLCASCRCPHMAPASLGPGAGAGADVPTGQAAGSGLFGLGGLEAAACLALGGFSLSGKRRGKSKLAGHEWGPVNANLAITREPACPLGIQWAFSGQHSACAHKHMLRSMARHAPGGPHPPSLDGLVVGGGVGSCSPAPQARRNPGSNPNLYPQHTHGVEQNGAESMSVNARLRPVRQGRL